MHLAIKIFDFVSITQIEGPLENSGKNEKKNLRVLAGQCLLLASKFSEVSRLYPAELVHNVR